MFNRKGIILAGGKGSRLSPITLATSKQLIPLYDKPMIYYPLTTLMLSDIKDFLIITTPEDINKFKALLKDGSQWGISIQYKMQEKPNGIAEAFLIAEEFINSSPVALILGDNFFYGQNFSKIVQKASKKNNGATIFATAVKKPDRYGVIEFDENKNVISIEEKPNKPKSKYAVTGLYFYDNEVCEHAKTLNPSNRGELEITDLNNIYISKRKLKAELFGRGTIWMDTGTFDSLQEASSFVKIIQSNQINKISCPEEISWRKSWISDKDLIITAKNFNNDYGKYLLDLLD